MTTYLFRCRRCDLFSEKSGVIGEVPAILCPQCAHPMERYLGGQLNPINYGFRPTRYETKEDRDIADYQFTNL